ncbi:NAD(P)-dependent oxidoreductase [Mesorhizobium sp. AR10]|uniref:NAD-dependent epimerase/dehydratase family protein n=1 Tax=Mesorhizobium sp. AR10 TaxID=2865839 RepID=UPI00215E3238|nr:NAD(P)-dependent oxidoreductase [Mesorhizobium sp. AR10]UVK36627.1 NAD(P)-dependent oxidoreductase [Mesorhizobium sp. AR10]
MSASDTPGKRIIFTGGTGKAGRHAIPYLLERGHDVLNLDLVPFAHPGVRTLITDLTDSGQTFNALSMHFDSSGLTTGKGPAPVDAVVHFAAIPALLLRPDNVTFQANVASTYNVIEAATKLGIRKIIIASSETTYGVCFAEGDKDFHQFPLEEDYDVDPMDSYGLSKVVNEKTARAFAMRFGTDIYALRIGNVIEPHDYERFPSFVAEPLSRKRNAWSYIDARDLGQIVDLCVRKDGLGFQVFNAVNDTITANEPTEAFLRRWCPDVPVTRPIGEFEAPLSNRKAREVLGFREEHDWRKYV